MSIEKHCPITFAMLASVAFEADPRPKPGEVSEMSRCFGKLCAWWVEHPEFDYLGACGVAKGEWLDDPTPTPKAGQRPLSASEEEM